MLSFPEEIVLLLLDETKGEFVPLPESVFAIVMSGAALMDLALRNRIDTDLEKLMVVDRTPLGDDILDDVLSGLADLQFAALVADTREPGQHIVEDVVAERRAVDDHQLFEVGIDAVAQR